MTHAELGQVGGCEDWAWLVVQTSVFRHVWNSRACIGHAVASSGRATCGRCGWALSAWIEDAGTLASAHFAFVALARIGAVLAIAVQVVITELFAAVLP